MTATDRAAKLAALATGTPVPAAPVAPAPAASSKPAEAKGKPTPAGGSVVVVMTRDDVPLAHGADTLAGVVYVYPRKGEAVAVDEQQAKRLLGLGWAVTPGTPVVDTVERPAGSTALDEELVAMTAAELTAYVAQHPGERERVYDLEQGRKRPRATVLSAVAPTPDADLIAAEAALAAEGDVEDDLNP